MVRPGISSREGMAGLEEGEEGLSDKNPVRPTGRTRSPHRLHLDSPQSSSEPARGAALDNNQLTPPHPTSSSGQTVGGEGQVASQQPQPSVSPPLLVDQTRKSDSQEPVPSSSSQPQVAVVNSYLGPMSNPTLYSTSGKKTRIASVPAGNGNQQRTVLLLNSAITNSPLLTGNGGIKQHIALLSSGQEHQHQRLPIPPARRHSTQEVVVDGPERTSTKTSFVTSAPRGLVPRLTHSRTINKGQPAFIQTQPIRRGVFAIGNRRIPPGHTYWATTSVNPGSNGQPQISSDSQQHQQRPSFYPHSNSSVPSSSGLRHAELSTLNSGNSSTTTFRSRTSLPGGKDGFQQSLSSTPNSPRAGITVKVSPSEPSRTQGVSLPPPLPYPHLRSALSADDVGSSSLRVPLGMEERGVLEQQELHSSPSPTHSAESDPGVNGRQRRLKKRATQLSSRVNRTLVERQTGNLIEEQIMDFVSECDHCLEPSIPAGDTTRPNTPPPSGDQAQQDSKKLLSPKNVLLEKKLDVIARSMDDQGRSNKQEGTKGGVDLGRLVRRYDAKKFGNMLTPNASVAYSSGRNQLSLSSGDAVSIGKNGGSLSAHLRRQQIHCDPEATESSSGGESCEEWDEARRPHVSKKKSLASPFISKEHPDLANRAVWRWMEERSRLGSRWGWLQSHMSDLEYKIRQHVDICRQIRARKAPLPPHTTITSSEGGSEERVEETCARVRPAFIRAKRKLVPSVGSHRWNRKAGREGSVGCGCFPPLPPCVMCSGRIHNVTTHPDLCSQTLWERIGVVDHSFNPVLSSHSKGLSLDKKIQAHLKKKGTASRSSPMKLRRSSGSTKWEETSNGDNPSKRNSSEISEGSPPKKKLPPLKIRLPTSSSHERFPGDGGSKSSKSGPNSLEETRGGRTRQKYSKKQQAARLERESRSNSRSRATTPDSGESDDSWEDEFFENFASSIESPGKYGNGSRRLASVGSVQTYDIDNIVIDPSVAAVCRVEKLQYKEIAIPGWRENELEKPNKGLEKVDQDIEDLRDDTFEQRHSQKESEERKKFQLYKESLWGPGLRKPLFDSDVFDSEQFVMDGSPFDELRNTSNSPASLHSRFFPDTLPIASPVQSLTHHSSLPSIPLKQELISAEPSPRGSPAVSP